MANDQQTSEMLLDVVGLYKTYASPAGVVHVLKDLSVTLFRGEFLAIVGESGSGKSTLLQLLGTLDSVDSGRAVLQGVSLFELSENECAHLRNITIGFVYQEHHLIPELSALENVMLPLLIAGVAHAEAEARAEALLSKLKLAHRLSHVPSRLSGGEAQRVAVARALVAKPKLLLVDEPTGNLDEESAQTVFQTMLALCREEGAAVMMVTHSMALAYQADRMLRLQHGQLVAFHRTEKPFDDERGAA